MVTLEGQSGIFGPNLGISNVASFVELDLGGLWVYVKVELKTFLALSIFVGSVLGDRAF